MAVRKIEVAKVEGMSSVPMRHGKEDASETYERGAVLIINSDNLAQASTEPTDNIAGISLAAASGTTHTDVAYIPAIPGVIFKGSIGTSTSAGAPALTDLLQLYPLQLSSGDWFVDKTDNTNPCVRVVDIDDDQIGVTNGTVYFQFITDAVLWAN